METTEPGEPPASSSAPQGASKLRVAWVATGQVLEALSATLNPLAVGLMDELVEVTLVCPIAFDPATLPAPPIDVIPHGGLRWGMFASRAAGKLAPQMTSRRVQLLHALDAGVVRVTRRIAHLVGVPFVVSSFGLRDGWRLGGPGDKAAALLPASELLRRKLLGARRYYIYISK